MRHPLTALMAMSPLAACPDALTHTISAPLRTAIRRKLLRWYDKNRRDLPWRRRQSDPYAQWVAEIMLQQTRVDTVVRYYDRFLRRFPNVRALSTADHEDVLKHWEGLGYYRRALNLHRAAQQLEHDRYKMPQTASDLSKLPGIGTYTAAAISSIAFRQREAAVDGNVARVIGRLFRIGDDVLSAIGKKRVERFARQLIPGDRPGDFNQAWMDLGSLVCVPKQPRCDVCPLLTHCQGASAGDAEDFPVRNGQRRVTRMLLVTVVFTRGDRLLVLRRPTGGLWSGLWEFPNAVCDHPSRQAATAKRVSPTVAALAKEQGLSAPASRRRIGSVKHQLTHRSLVFEVYVAEIPPEQTGLRRRGRRWVTIQDFERLSVSRAYRRVFDVAREGFSRR